MSVLGYDRVKASFLALARSALPRADYMCAYRGIVVSQSGQTVDVRMEDARIPGMSGLPIQIGIPAATVEVASGARVMVMFTDGDPAKPVALLFDEGAHCTRVSFPADLLELGGEGLNIAQDGAIQGTAIDPFTGLTQWQLGNASRVVLVKK